MKTFVSPLGIAILLFLWQHKQPDGVHAFVTEQPIATQTLSRITSLRLPSSKSSASTEQPHPSPEATGKRVVICGGGIGGLSTAFDARHILRPQDEIIVVSDREEFQFTPSNPWVAVRKRTAQDISISLTKVLPKHNIEFVHAAVRSLNPKRQQLVLNDGTQMPYDYLVIATGPRLGFDEIPGARGVQDHRHPTMASICTTPHAMAAAETYDRLAAQPGPIVVGAVQEASCFGPAYEYAMLIQHELKQRGGSKLVTQCPIHFVTPEPYIGHLGLRGAGDSHQILTKMLEERHIKYTTNCRVQRVNPDSVAIQYYDDNDEVHNDVLPSHLTMLIPAFRGINAWKSAPGLTDDHGMILVDKHQQSLQYPNIFGVGVCVHIDPIDHTRVPTGVPKTGYMIESMGTAAVQNIRDMIKAKEHGKEEDRIQELHHVPLLNGLCITDFGDTGAVFVAMPQIPPRSHDYTVTGKIGVLAKMAFEKYFLYKIQSGDTDPYYEKYALALIGVKRTTQQ